MLKLSIIIPVFNTGKYIKKCMDSVLCSSSKEFEVIVVNDGTEDDTLKIIECEYFDSRLKIINKKNGGLSSARNRGILESSGEYILHLDSDDYLKTGAIDVLLNAMNKYNVDVVIFDVNVVKNNKNNKNNIWVDGIFEEDTFFSGEEYLNQYFDGRCIPSCWNKVIKKELYLEHKIEHPLDISYGEDGSTVPRLMYHAEKIIKIKDNLYNYVQHPNAMTKSNDINKKIREYKKAFSLVDSYMISNNFPCYENKRYYFKIWYLYSLLNVHTKRNVEMDVSSEIYVLYKEYIDDVKNNTLSIRVINQADNLSAKFFLFVIWLSSKNYKVGESLKNIILHFKSVL